MNTAQRANLIAELTLTELQKLAKKFPGFEIKKNTYRFEDGSILTAKEVLNRLRRSKHEQI